MYTQTITITGNTLVRSRASLDTMDLALVVHPGASLTVHAPAVSMKKGEASAHQGNNWKNSIFNNSSSTTVQHWLLCEVPIQRTDFARK